MLTTVVDVGIVGTVIVISEVEVDAGVVVVVVVVVVVTPVAWHDAKARETAITESLRMRILTTSNSDAKSVVPTSHGGIYPSHPDEKNGQ